MILHGTNLVISAGGSALAASKSCTIDVAADEIKISTPHDNMWENVMAGRRSWSISTSHLLVAGDVDAAITASVDRSGSTVTTGNATYTAPGKGLNFLRIDASTYTPIGTWENFNTYDDPEGEGDRMVQFIDNIGTEFLAAIVSHEGFGLTKQLRDIIANYMLVSLDDVPIGADDGALVVIGGDGTVDLGVTSYGASNGADVKGHASTMLYMADGWSAPYSPLRESVEKVGQIFDIRVQVEGLPFDVLTGKALCKSYRVTGSRGNLIQGSFAWKGAGPLT